MYRKLIFDLARDLAAKPEFVERARRATLDSSQQHFGLLGKYGLLDSPEWWENVRNGTVPRRTIRGTVVRRYYVGMDTPDGDNTIEILTRDGNTEFVALLANDETGDELIQVGRSIEVTLIEETYKPVMPDGTHEVLEEVLEIAVLLD